MKWETVQLGDIAEFSNGVNFNKSAYSDGIKLIGVSDFGNRFSPDYTSLDEIKKEVVRTNDYLQHGDIVFVRSNGNKELVGRCMLINKPTIPVTYSGFCIRARLIDISKYNPIFFTYLFKSKAFRKTLTGTAIGANIQNLSQSRLKSCSVQIPNFDTQKRIADILSAYDNLIENNQKQIKLLEEAAQRLYKEWFVDLRFPGYENTPIIDGVPEGWRKFSLSEMAVLSAGGDRPKIFSKEKTQSCCIPVFSNGTENEGLYGYTNVATIRDHCVTISARGNVGYICLRRKEFVPIVRLITVIPKNEHVEYLFFYLKNKNFKSNGAAQQQITVPMIKDEIVLLPPLDVLIAFKTKVVSMFDLRDNLKMQNEKCKETRDRLLPKLTSGELEV